MKKERCSYNEFTATQCKSVRAPGKRFCEECCKVLAREQQEAIAKHKPAGPTEEDIFWHFYA